MFLATCVVEVEVHLRSECEGFLKKWEMCDEVFDIVKKQLGHGWQFEEGDLTSCSQEEEGRRGNEQVK